MTQDVFAQLSLDSSLDYATARTNMVKQQIRTWGVLDDKILSLFYSVQRENFVPAASRSLAFADTSIPLAHDQKMMPPKEEARIVQALEITPHDKVLVLGTDSGFLVTLLAHLAQQVYYIDSNLESFENVKQKCAALSNVIPLIGNLHKGWQDIYPFEVIVLTGSLPSIPEILKNALALKGRLFVVVGNLPVMTATIVTRSSINTWEEKALFETERPRLLDTRENTQFEF